MDTCQFSYIHRKTCLPVTALGIERSWDDLKVEFDRSGPGIPGATYYKTISVQGPELFAVINENSVYYHDDGQWHRYITATNVKFGQMNTTDDPKRATTEATNQLVSDTFSEEEQHGLETED